MSTSYFIAETRPDYRLVFLTLILGDFPDFITALAYALRTHRLLSLEGFAIAGKIKSEFMA